jgi:radical SAM protein with 4Fe4S-binding SPASM domain
MSPEPLAITSSQSSYSTTLEFFTANCNLRCVYCGIQTDKTDFPDYPRQQMAPEIIDHIKQLFAQDRPKTINLCGNGETTMLENWTAICEPFLSLTDHPSIISNLAKVLNWEEVSFLAKFGTLSTSIDTADAELLREIRKPAQLCNIVLNLGLVKAAAFIQGKKPPVININCTVTTKNYRELTKLVALVSALGINHIQFSNVFETPNAIAQGVRSIATLAPLELAEARNELEKAKALAKRQGVNVGVNSQFEAIFIGTNVSQEKHRDQSTVQCLQPWDNFMVNADGHVSCCCRHMGASDKKITSYNSIREVLNNENAVRLREALLSGRCPERCRSCELGSSVDLSTFRRRIKTRDITNKHRELAAVVKRIPFARSAWRAFKQI